MRVLFAASEIFPFAKSGGLADVAHSLPAALRDKDIDVVAVMPLYGFIDRVKHGIRFLESFPVRVGSRRYEVRLFGADNDGVPTLFVDAAGFFRRAGMYGDARGDYADNDLRFGLLCAVIVELAVRLHADALHLNDWHTAPAAFWLKQRRVPVRSVFTIHNLAYQGVFERRSLERLGLPRGLFTMEGMEFYGRLNWMKAGIAFADAVTTVSPGYAREILTPEFGCGLDGFLRKHETKLLGLLNGIDQRFFDPEKDNALFRRYSAEYFKGKALHKTRMLRELELKSPERPLMVMVTRLAQQKGMDQLLGCLDALLQLPLNLAILGDGDGYYTARLHEAASERENFRFMTGYDEVLAHRFYGAADLFLMPSAFEPCGLSQMIAMRYGAVPVVRAVGGLADTVGDYASEGNICGRGIRFEGGEPEVLLWAVRSALELWQRPETFCAVARADMACDFSFDRSAEAYIALYAGDDKETL